jgi:uncharacterized protein YjbJ (UPF0337 family)
VQDGLIIVCRCLPNATLFQPVLLRDQSAHPSGGLPAKQSRMNTLQIKGNWNHIKGKLKEKYWQLTDDDLTFVQGGEEELLDRLQDRLGISKEEIRREIEKAQETFKVVVDKAEEALDTGRQYVRENSLAVIVGALLLGIIVGVLLAPRPRKEPDAVQTVRDWLEGTREDFVKRWPQAKKQAKAIQEDIVDQAQTVGKKLQEDIVDQAQTLGKKLHLWGS